LPFAAGIHSIGVIIRILIRAILAIIMVAAARK